MIASFYYDMPEVKVVTAYPLINSKEADIVEKDT